MRCSSPDCRVTYQATVDHYRLDGLEALPRPIQNPRPPVLVGGGGPRMLALAGALADIAGVHARLGPSGFDAQAAEGSAGGIVKKINLVADCCVRIRTTNA